MQGIPSLYYFRSFTFSRLTRTSFLSRVLLFFSLSNLIIVSFNYILNLKRTPTINILGSNKIDELFLGPKINNLAISQNLIKIESDILAQEELEKRDPLISIETEYGSDYGSLPQKISSQAMPLLKHMELKKGDKFKLYYQSGKVKLIKSAKKFVVMYKFGLYDHSGLRIDQKQKSRVLTDLVTSIGKPTRISSGYGFRIHPIFKDTRFHPGVDIAAPTGSKIHAAFDGKVTKVGYSNTYGTHIVVQHEDSISSLYGHLDSVNVKIGDWVSQNQVIGKVGKSGRARGAHLHFELRKSNKHVNPGSVKGVSIRLRDKGILKKAIESLLDE